MKASFKFSLSLISVLFGLTLSAAAQKITGILTDSVTGETLPFATVSIIPQGQQKALKYVLTTSEGVIDFNSVKKGSYTIKAELMGYKTYTREIKVDGAVLKLGNIALEPDYKVLDAAKVTDTGNQITVKKDTIEYNATLFKTSDNDMLIDLLKKLPGIEVETDGSITANGREIKKITIDGKTFFLDDPQLATKNIPSKIIEKVKVVDKKSDQAIFTGIDDGEEETVIDLGIKKGMMKGWFGNVMGGGGHDLPKVGVNDLNDWRYQGAGFIGNFTDKSQVSVILNGNNTNNRGFNDMAGSMMGNMRGGGGRGMGRGGNSGITTSWMGGVNGAFDLLGDKMDLAGNYLYSGTDKYVEEESTKNTFISQDETLNYHSKGTNNTGSRGHRIGIRLEHKFSDNTSILFEPQFNIGSGSFNEYSRFDTRRQKTGMAEESVNNGFNSNDGANRNWTASGWGLLRQRLGKPGRTVTVNFRYNFSNNDLAGKNQSKSESADTTEIVNQRYDQNARNKQLTGGVTYTEPLWTNWYLEANYSYTWREQDSNKKTFDSGSFDSRGDSFIYNYTGEVLNSQFSNSIRNTSHAHRAGANVMYQTKKVRAQLGFTANPTRTINNTVSNGKSREYRSDVINFAPQASLSFDFSDNSNMRFMYRGRSSQPSTSQLMPVPDNSDPLDISLGNPGLKPYFNHMIRGMFRYSNKQNFLSVNASLEGSITENPIINTSWYDKAGAQFSLPTNGPTNGSGSLRVLVNSPIGKTGLSIFNMLNLRYNESSNYIANGSLDMSRYYIGSNKNDFNYDLFLKDYGNLGDHPDEFSLNKSTTVGFTERFRLTYRADIVELSAGIRTRMSRACYSVQASKNNCTWSNQADASVNFTIPGGINLISDFNYNWYRGYTTPQESTAILNAEITKLLFKDKVTLGVKAYDLLAQARSLNVSDTANYHQETRNNTLGRYIIVSLTYRFGNFGDARSRMRGQRGHGGYGRGGYGGMRR